MNVIDMSLQINIVSYLVFPKSALPYGVQVFRQDAIGQHFEWVALARRVKSLAQAIEFIHQQTAFSIRQIDGEEKRAAAG